VKITIKLCLSLAALLLVMTNTALAQPYEPLGVQTNVPKSTVLNGGWTECYTDLYGDTGISLSSILAQCPGAKMMLACSELNADAFVTLGQADYADVTFNTGTGNVTHQANDVEWYFDEENSWGFAPLGETVSRNSCDTNSSAAEQRLCWHTGSGDLEGGWRCGATTSLNSSSTWVRHILINGDLPVASPVPANNHYALALLILLLSSIGYVAIRRYH